MIFTTDVDIVGDPELLSKLTNHVHSHYPLDASLLLKSLPHQTLEVLYRFFRGVFPPRELDGQVFRDRVAAASQITGVLRALACMKFDRDSTDYLIPRGDTIRKGKGPRKHMKPGTRMSTPTDAADADAFRALGLAVPSSDIEASQIADDLFDAHKETLTVGKDGRPDRKLVLTNVSRSTSLNSLDFPPFTLLFWGRSCTLLKPR